MKFVIILFCFLPLLVNTESVLDGLSCLLGKCMYKSNCLLNICLGKEQKGSEATQHLYNTLQEQGEPGYNVIGPKDPHEITYGNVNMHGKQNPSYSKTITGSEGITFGNVHIQGDKSKSDSKTIIETKAKNKKEFKPTDCLDIRNSGSTKSGVYTIWLAKDRSLQVYCDMDTDDGGWIVIQRRGNFSTQENFYRDWAAYKEGFGDLKKDFWLGNENIFAITSQQLQSIRFDLQDNEGIKGYATYDQFSIGDESSKYALYISGFEGDAGDAMATHNGKKFSTKDKGNDDTATGNTCAGLCQGGWWYANCYTANLNGLYRPGKKNVQAAMMWRNFRVNDGLFSSQIKLRRIPIT